MCVPNVGLVITPKFYHGGPNGCPHSWGDEVLVVPEKVLAVLGITPEELSEKGHLPAEDDEEDDEEDVPVFPGEVIALTHGQRETDVDGNVWVFNAPEDKWEYA